MQVQTCQTMARSLTYNHVFSVQEEVVAPAVVRAIDLVAAAWPPDEQVLPRKCMPRTLEVAVSNPPLQLPLMHKPPRVFAGGDVAAKPGHARRLSDTLPRHVHVAITERPQGGAAACCDKLGLHCARLGQ